MVSSRERVATGVLLALLSACSVGTGEGQVSGTLTVPDCEIDGPYDLEPSFFGGEPIEQQFEIRLQRGSDFEDKSDGMLILVRDTDRIRRELIGLRVPVGIAPDSLVRMTLFLNESCPVNRDDPPVHLQATGGTITFQSIYAPSINEDEVETAARFEVDLVDASDDPLSPSSGRSAQLSGEFRFLYTRGRPAQRFP